MVCLVSPILKKEMVENKESDIEMITEDVFDENFDDEYSLVRLAGGRIIDHPPLFTPNGKYLLIIYHQKVLMYSTSTGEWIRDFEEFGKSDLVSMEFLLNDSQNLIGCSMKGEVTYWDWKDGSICNRSKLPINGVLKTFTLLNMPNGLFSLITYRNQENNLKYDIVNIQDNTVLNCPLDVNLKDSNDDIITIAETKFFHYFTIAQRQNLLVVDYRTWRYKLWKSAKKSKITVLATHPTELLLATGDETGRIFLYREFFKHGRECVTTLYAWHHTPVTSITFTLSGSGFYSGGYEAVLVKWNIHKPHLKEFYPRLPGHICHIAVGDRNRKLAVSTADNGIQILNDQNELICILQNFTFVYDNKCEQKKFPVGLLLDPVNNSLVSNGKFGHLQFFSTHTRSLLYNIDIVMQNKLSTEVHKVLYDTVITTAAFNANWMATGELWDDREHLPEFRLKFWEYTKQNQAYILNTSVELPHEGEVKAIRFSSAHNVDNLVCASLGNDNYVKIWSLENMNDVRKDRKMWVCVAKTKYKNYKASSIDFSSDGSLLSVGYGNTLCIFKTDDLRLKAALTAPPVYDGSFQKVQICYNEKKLENIQINENYRQIIDTFRNFEEDSGDKSIVKILQKNPARSKFKIGVSSPALHNKNNSILFKKIFQIPELNLSQKLIILQKLNIHFVVSSNAYPKVLEYMNSNLDKDLKEKHLRNYTKFLSAKCKFKAKYRLRKYYSRKNIYQNIVNETLVPLLNMLKVEDKHNSAEENSVKPNCNGFSDNSFTNSSEEVKRKTVNNAKRFVHLPNNLQNISELKIVRFGKGEFTHLVIIATEHRVIVWNILSLRIQFVLKLSVKEIVVDELTSLCAVFTCNNELLIFLPNAPLYLYRRCGLPEVFGACWVPRKYPKSTSLNLDWQSFSTLYFLTGNQEIVYLSTTKDEENKSSISFVNDADEITRQSIFEVHSSRKLGQKTVALDASMVKIGTPGNAEVKSIVQIASHASAPMNVLCSNFIQSFLSKYAENFERVKETNSTKIPKSESSSDEEVDEVYLRIKERRRLLADSLESSSKIENASIKKRLKEAVKEVLPKTIDF